MASLLSLSSTTLPSPPRPSIRLFSSSFKGNVGNLREKAFTFEPAKLRFRCRVGDRRPLVVVNQAASPAASGLGIGDGPSISTARFRLDNLGPQPGSRRRAKRKGRGHAAGQGKTCGFGMKGQKSRSGPGIRKGFEGGQMPLYRRIPKLRGIAGGMRAGLPKYVHINLKDIEAAGFREGEEVSLESLKSKGLINPSGRERTLPLKILADGEINVKLSIKARAFSSAAKEKLEAAGCSLTKLPGRRKWVKPAVAKNLARAEAYFAAKKAAAAAAAVVDTAA